ncbi:hypothetical protein KEM48_001292 [Puccinia striiformis f. sp. tritici PST-130]|nr:hypothetical protein KEM48_001292 [Puccinia striiformis f. sp. tritici PST-130]
MAKLRHAVPGEGFAPFDELDQPTQALSLHDVLHRLRKDKDIVRDFIFVHSNVTFFGKNARPCLRSAASSSSRIAQSSAKFMDTSIRESPLEARFEYKVKISPVQDDRPPDHSALNPSDRSHRSNQRRSYIPISRLKSSGQ